MDLLCHHHRRRRPPRLTTLPNELLNEIAFYLACDTLVGLPCSLLPLLLTCKRVYDALKEDQAIWRRVFKFKFSWSSVERRRGASSRGRYANGMRKMRPMENADYQFQLQLYVRTLKDIRTRVGFLHLTTSSSSASDLGNGDDNGNEEKTFADPVPDPSHVDFDELQSVEELMWVLWVMCLEDDGCNRIQMDGAGAYEWVEAFVRKRLYNGAVEGWPRDNAVNSCALHVLWYLTTKERLFLESDHARESLVRIVLPFVTIPFRYSSSFAPPNHFHLPPVDAHCRTTSIPTAHGPYPLYLSPDQRVWKHVFYNRRVPITIPLITDAAKLLYAARRELWRFPVMHQLARNRTEYNLRTPVQADGQRPIRPTQEDFEELNETLLGGEAMVPGSSTEQNPYGVSRARARGRGGGTALTSLPTVVYSPLISTSTSDVGYSARHVKHIIQIDESGCASQRWDKDWWRLRKCLNCFEDDSSFLYDVEDVDDDADWEDDTVGSDDDVDIGVDDAKESIQPEEGMDVRKIRPPPGSGVQVYTPGQMTGLWVGKIFIPSQRQFEDLMHATPVQPGRSPRLPENFSENTFSTVASLPVYMRLREHRRTSTITRPSALVPEGSMLNAWFPNRMEYNEDKDKGEVQLSFDGARRAFYETIHRGEEDIDEGWEGDDDDDIIITGETDPRHGQAWKHYQFYGRIRKWDGCVTIMRVPAEDTRTSNSGKGRILFYGTLVGGGKNFVGNWRVADMDETSPAYEGAFSLGKKEE
ncbi:hypothetical protein E1B28_002918 [Marasmius oreades]|uniref:F-box domain-containing protein n=1 Tax=Marasmius oreades TaxID=181124 RepID=A0A9P7UIU5_9AGAR|nr:uncharacterized protein E1B28_002918 [Marasmius oreades]KAG7085352.1 hypothetical protein E1B28_002918 [Marasmius oreades]